MSNLNISPRNIGDWAIIAVILIQVITFAAFAVWHSQIEYGYANATIIGVLWYLEEVVVHND